MLRICIDMRGEVLPGEIPQLGDFAGCGTNPETRYDMAIGSDIDIVTLIDATGVKVGYCSFFTNEVSELVGNEVLAGYQIDYVFIKEEFRGRRLSKLMAPFLAREIILFINSLKTRHGKAPINFNDNSQYVSTGGWKFNEYMKDCIKESELGL